MCVLGEQLFLEIPILGKRWEVGRVLTRLPWVRRSGARRARASPRTAAYNPHGSISAGRRRLERTTCTGSFKATGGS